MDRDADGRTAGSTGARDASGEVRGGRRRRSAPARRAGIVVALAALLLPVAGVGLASGPAQADGILDVVDLSPPRDHVAQCLPGVVPKARRHGLTMGISALPATEASASELAPVLATAPRGMTVQLWAHYRSADRAEQQETIATLEADAAFWASKGYRLTLTIPYRTTEPLVAGYGRFVSRVLRRVGPRTERVYITNEANLPGSPATSDGASPRVVEALVAGVAAADHTARALQLRTRIGFKVAASIRDDEFWSALATRATRRFRAAVDVVGVDLYPTPPTAQPGQDISGFVLGNLALLRGCRLPAVGLGHAAFDVTESGASHFWFRPPDQAGRVLRTMIRTAYDYSRSLGIVGWTQWGLACDASSTQVPGDFLGCMGLIDSTTGVHLPSFDIFARAAATNGAVEPEPTPPPPPPPPPQVDPARHWLKAARANAAIGRGVEIVSPCCDGGSGTIEGAAGAARLAGFRSVRYSVHLSTKQDASPPYAVDPAYLAQIRAELDVLLAHGFTVVLNNNDNLNDPEHSGNRLPTMWRQVAEYFEDLPPGVYFEIANEPTWTGGINTMLTSDEWNPIVTRSIAAIRESNPRRVIVVGAALLSLPQLVPALEVPEGDPYLIASFHDYLPLELTHQGSWFPGSDAWVGTTWSGAPEEIAAMKGAMNDAVCWSRRNGVPLFLGEFGVNYTADTSSRAAWTGELVRLAEAEHISWAYFVFNGHPEYPTPGQWGLFNERTGFWDHPILDAFRQASATPSPPWADCPSP